MKARTALLLSVLALALAGCRGWQSALDPQGPQARELAWLFWMFTAVLAAIWVAVMIALAVALIAPRPAARRPARSRPGTRAAHELRRRRPCRRDRRDGSGADRVQLRLAAQPLPGRGGGGDDPHHREPMVVGRPLRGRRREPQLHDRKRAPHPDRPAGEGQARVGGRDPLLLGPEPHGQAGPDPGPGERHPPRRRPAGHLPRPMRRVLRPAARPYGHPRRRRGRGGLRRAGAMRRSNPPIRPTTPTGKRGSRRSCRGPASCAIRCAARRPAGGSRPT